MCCDEENHQQKRKDVKLENETFKIIKHLGIKKLFGLYAYFRFRASFIPI